ncbi:GDSL esterase/lipase At4g10955-like isoform X2 [Rhododendron vialii]|uniref:GDSL esterase/lipase At4g10955-like isoform X2 n=1 Tax=Rhododendron vialii TaxID=182163 RepID=UPI00265D91AB|nr:GDSL esterase/lipase At4g10955-like isoform X2 [Rhododendron vialii]
MVSDKERFDLSGPSHLIDHVDWNNVNHQRSVAACSVQGVKILERDRQENRRGPEALASRWWEFFGFRLHAPLIDDDDHSIFGAIYEFTSPSYDNHLTMNGTPRYIIAFRGTLNKGPAFLGSLTMGRPCTWLRDSEVNLHIMKSTLHQTSRFEIAMQSVRNIAVAAFRNSNIWLTGHSQGAAIAMLAGKTMVKEGIFLEAFLFNPPVVSAHIGEIKNEKVQQAVRTTKSVVVAAVRTVARKAHHQQTDVSEDPFVALSGWVPRLYVHPGDHICSEYVKYFEHRELMEKIGLGCVEKVASQHSLRVIVGSAMGKESEEPLHLIPSAELIVNLTPANAFKAHGLRQWWRSDMQLQPKKCFCY